MGIDLEIKNYYLKVINSSSDDILGADASPLYNTLYIGETRFDISINPSYIGLNPNEFSENLGIKLEKGIVGDELMLVHEKHDGTYEVIPTTYDASTNTLTFKTSSFSNYAIATKLSNSPKIGGKTQVSIPKTGDNIARYILPIALGFAALTVLLAVKKKSKKTLN